ncbi:lysozyme [Sphingomonas sp. Sphisp140]|uniref:lysozyme n=1 Tax=unclassified Sphingomonas TaxID=196159 RepID=UPI0039AEFDAD
MTPSQNCVSLVEEFEGCAQKQADGSFKAYPDPGTGGEPWTIGWGSTGSDITESTVWTQAQCDARLQSSLTSFSAQVSSLLEGGAPTSQNQFDALVDFAYNLGVGNLSSSTLLKLHKQGDYAGAAAQFPLWDHADGKVMPGLQKRRAAEQTLYETP